MPLPAGPNLSGEGVCIPRFNPFFTKLEEVRVLAQDAFDNAWLALSLINAGKSSIKIFNSVADAAAFAYPGGAQLVFTAGTLVYGDGGAGFWLFDPASILVADGYSIFDTTGATGKLIKQL